MDQFGCVVSFGESIVFFGFVFLYPLYDRTGYAGVEDGVMFIGCDVYVVFFLIFVFHF